MSNPQKYSYRLAFERFSVIFLIYAVIGLAIYMAVRIVLKIELDWTYYFQGVFVICLATFAMVVEAKVRHDNTMRARQHSNEAYLKYLQRSLIWGYMKPYLHIIVGFGGMWFVILNHDEFPQIIVLLMVAVVAHSFIGWSIDSTTTRELQLKKAIDDLKNNTTNNDSGNT